MINNNIEQLLRKIPRVDYLAAQARLIPEGDLFSEAELLRGVRTALDRLREDILSGSADSIPDENHLIRSAINLAAGEKECNLRQVINCTGVILHTNLGRAPLSPYVAEHLCRIAKSYSTLEYDTAAGRRGSRHSHVEQILTQLTGAEAAMVVNNNAAAVLLALSALCRNKEVIVSRGELAEIGGSFRIPEVIEQGGAKLRETGSTNKTRITDYRNAFDPELTGGLLKVHPSNYRIIGFTEQTSPRELSALGREKNVPFIYDLGSGSLLDLSPLGVTDELTVQEAVSSGADIVCFSGDKLLGASQAGIVVGKKIYIDQLKSNPLARALRVDKLTLSALEVSLRLYSNPDEAKKKIPVLSMLFASDEELRTKAEQLYSQLEEFTDFEASVVHTESRIGGGAAPDFALPSWGIAIHPRKYSLGQLETALRKQYPAVIGRIVKDRLTLDVRTIANDELSLIYDAFSKL